MPEILTRSFASSELDTTQSERAVDTQQKNDVDPPPKLTCTERKTFPSAQVYLQRWAGTELEWDMKWTSQSGWGAAASYNKKITDEAMHTLTEGPRPLLLDAHASLEMGAFGTAALYEISKCCIRQ